MKQLAILAVGLSLAGAAVAATPPSAERAYIDGAFAAVDSNKDNAISRQEFDAFMLARIKKQRAEFDKGFAAADANGDGFIDRKEAGIEPTLAQHFDPLDSNKDGKLSKSEMTAALLAAMQQGSLAAGG
ncbi:EF-hand domain-containing protein [Pseudomonas sp. CGJS7]|uniref:EF-hand domain-containing protein n=1 Tax=Pseudomonas sp. CGJS7 TaxID=3109348 RepID=UPI0030082EC6